MSKLLSALMQKFERSRERRRWTYLRSLGMSIGDSVYLPADTWIDVSHCYLISIGDDCGFGPECMLLAHDAQMNEYLDAARIGRITIHASSHIGARTVILPGVEIGPRTIVGANSLVARSLPPETVCAGNPARVLCSLDEYLAKHRRQLQERPAFDFLSYQIETLTREKREAMLAAVQAGDAYMTGGYTAELEGKGGSDRIPGIRKSVLRNEPLPPGA